MTELRERLQALVEEGARGFDRATVRYLSTLLDRAEAEASVTVRERLRSRIESRMQALAREMERAKEGAVAVVRELEALDPEGAIEVRALVEGGDFREAERLGRKKIRDFDPEASARLLSRLGRIQAQARAHDVRLPADLREGARSLLRHAKPLGSEALRRGRLLAYELSAALLDAVLLRSRGSLDFQRILRRHNLPEQIGPYNPHAIASRTLERMGRLSPSYLHTWFEVLEEMAALERLMPPPAPTGKKKKR